MTTRILDILMAAGAALAVLLGSFGAFARECDEIPQEVLRLHIPANSDSEFDLAVKHGGEFLGGGGGGGGAGGRAV